MHMFNSCTEYMCVCVCMYTNGRVVGLFSEGGSPIPLPLFSVSLSALQLLRVSALQYSESICRLNSAPEGKGIKIQGATGSRRVRGRVRVRLRALELLCHPVRPL